ncbi:MAG: RHS repeat protein [Clostridia bacterium]|nr:RHS repeat protein [Clostridia bacterium]
MKKIIAFTLCMLLLSLCSCTDTTPSQTPVSEEEAPVNETYTATALRKMTLRIFSEDNGEMTREDQYEYHYGEDGLRIGETYTGLGELRGENEYEYDEKGRCIAYHQQRIGYDDWYFTTEYRYDDEDHLIGKLWPRGQEWTYSYDNAGRLSLKTYRTAGEEFPSKTYEHVYDAEGGYTELYQGFNDPATDTEPTYVTVWTVNENELLVSKENRDEFDGYEHHFTYEYDFDEEGRVVERRELCKEFDGEVTEIVSWTYDEEGRIRSIVSGKMDLEQFEKDGTEKTDLVRIDLFYDEEGRLIQYTEQSGTDGNLRREEYLYEYGAVEVEESLSGKDLSEKDLVRACPMVKGYLPWRIVE